MIRREFLRHGSTGAFAALLPAVPVVLAAPLAAQDKPTGAPAPASFNVRHFGATGDGTTIDSPAINRAIDAAAAVGGGTVYFPAGVYASYTVRLKSHISLHLDAGATLLAAGVPNEGTTSGGYDPAGPAQPWEAYQDYGHNHWPNSLIYGESLEGISIFGPGLIWGKGLSRGEANELPKAESPGVGNKAIALKNCRNVLLRDFSVLMGGHFAVLLTGVDNVVIDGLTIDTNRDGIDIDCCRNVRVANCSVNSPWDDAICPKSSFALGYARTTENVMITNCYVTGQFEYGTLLDGTFKRKTYSQERKAIGRIKCGTESNGGFRAITISNCILDGCRGFALETVDGAIIEDITVTNLSLRNVVHSPIFLRLGTRMRGPKGVAPGALRRVILSNFTSYHAAPEYPSIISGVPGSLIEDIKVSDMYLENHGGGTADWAAIDPPEKEAAYPEASMFGTLPARGFLLRHARNLEFSNIEIATETPDARPAFWAHDVDGLDLFRVRVGRNTAAFALHSVKDFRSFGSKDTKDTTQASIDKLNY
jgi:polygalacturonase